MLRNKTTVWYSSSILRESAGETAIRSCELSHLVLFLCDARHACVHCGSGGLRARARGGVGKCNRTVRR